MIHAVLVKQTLTMKVQFPATSRDDHKVKGRGRSVARIVCSNVTPAPVAAANHQVPAMRTTSSTLQLRNRLRQIITTQNILTNLKPEPRTRPRANIQPIVTSSVDDTIFRRKDNIPSYLCPVLALKETGSIDYTTNEQPFDAGERSMIQVSCLIRLFLPLFNIISR